MYRDIYPLVGDGLRASDRPGSGLWPGPGVIFCSGPGRGQAGSYFVQGRAEARPGRIVFGAEVGATILSNAVAGAGAEFYFNKYLLCLLLTKGCNFIYNFAGHLVY